MLRRSMWVGVPVGVAAAVWALSVAVSAAVAPASVADAAMREDHDAVRTMLRRGVDVNVAEGDGMTALHWAAAKGDAALAKLLIEAGANPRATTRVGPQTPLHLAARIGNAPVIEVLLKAGADPNAATVTG